MSLLLLLYVDVVVEWRHSRVAAFIVFVIVTLIGSAAYVCLCFYCYFCILIIPLFPLHEDTHIAPAVLPLL